MRRELKDETRGPATGFVYKRKQNNKGEEVGGIAPHVGLESIANNERPKEEVLVDRPEKDDHITRVSGAFCVEATIPTPVGLGIDAANAPSETTGGEENVATFAERMLEVIRKSPILRLEGNKAVTLKNIRPPAMISPGARPGPHRSAAGDCSRDAIRLLRFRWTWG